MFRALTVISGVSALVGFPIVQWDHVRVHFFAHLVLNTTRMGHFGHIEELSFVIEQNWPTSFGLRPTLSGEGGTKNNWSSFKTVFIDTWRLLISFCGFLLSWLVLGNILYFCLLWFSGKSPLNC